MKELKFKDDPEALEKLSKICNEIQDFVDNHPKQLNEQEHKELRVLLNERAKALSNATGWDIHSISEDDE